MDELIAAFVLMAVGIGFVALLVLAVVRLFSRRQENPFEPPVTPIDELTITARQLRRLRERGLLDEATFAEAMRAVRAARRGEPTVQPTPAPAALTASATAPPPLPPPMLRPESPEHARPVVLPPPIPQPVRRIERPVPQPVAPIAKEPRKTLAELLGRFMEESNIRWGELVGGLLIVGCSIALVLTFWNWIESRPWVKFFLFTAVTASIFLVGIYTERRWKLPHTSRGLLLIATLLVPLNFLAIAAFSQGMPAMMPLRLGGEVVAVGLFAWLVWMAGRVLAPDLAGLLSLGVLGASASQGIIHRLALPHAQASVTTALLLAGLPLAFYCVSTLLAVARAWRQPGMEQEHAARLLRFLGPASFAAILPVGLLAHMSGSASWLMQQAAPLLCLGGLPALATGLLIQRRIDDTGLANTRTAGTSVATVGAMALLSGLAMAWPNPASLLAVALVDFVVLGAVAVVYRMPVAHVPALACAALAYLLGFHLLMPQSLAAPLSWHASWRSLIAALLSCRSAAALVGCFGLYAGGAMAWRRAGRREDARWYGLVSAAVAALSLGLAGYHGLWRIEDHGVTWIFAFYALAAYAGAWVLRSPTASWAGTALLAVAFVQAIAFRFRDALGLGLSDGVAMGLLGHATVMALTATVARLLMNNDAQRAWRTVFAQAATVGSAAAAAILLFNLPAINAGPMNALAWRALWVAGIWLVVALVAGSGGLFVAFQGALTAAVGVAVLAVLQRHEWFAASSRPLAEPWTLQAVGTAWAILGILWTGTRTLLARRLWPESLPVRTEPKLDRWIIGVVLAGLVGLSIRAVWPGIEAELSARGSVRAVAANPCAWSSGAWLLLGGATLALLAAMRERFNRWMALGIVLALACAGPLLAARWEAQTASASALRWTLAALLLLLSVPAWSVRRDQARELIRDARTLLLAITVPFVLMLTIYPAVVRLGGQQIVGPDPQSLFGRMGDAGSYLPPMLMVFAALVGYGLRERSAGFAFAAGLVLNLTVTLGYLLALVTAGIPIQQVQLVRLAQFNAIASAAFALAWMAVCRSAMHPAEGEEPGPVKLLLVQAGIPIAILGCLLVIAELMLVGAGTDRLPVVVAAGSAGGWLAWALAGAAALWVGGNPRRFPLDGVAVGLLVAGSMLAFTICAAGNQWIAQHALLAARVTAAWALLGVGWARMELRGHTETDPVAIDSMRDAVTRWATVFGLLALALSLRATYQDPSSPTWAVAGFISLSGLSVGLAFWTMSRAWLYPAGLLLNAAATVWWVVKLAPASPAPVFELALVNTIVLALAGVAMLVLELTFFRPMSAQVVRRGLPYHRLAARLAGALVIVSGAALLLGWRSGSSWALIWSAIAATGALMLGCLWDVDARFVLRGLYGLGLATMAAGAVHLGASFRDLISFGPVALAGYGLVLGYLYVMRVSLARLARLGGVPLRDGWPTEGPCWLGGWMMAQSILAALLALATVLTRDELWIRLAGGTAAIGAAVAIGLLARCRPALLLGMVGAVLWGWAWLEPGAPGELLNRAVIVMLVTAAVAIFYAVGMVKLLRQVNAWTDAAQSLAPIVGGVMLASLLLVLGTELAQADRFGTDIAWWGIVAVLGVLIGLAAAGIICAVVPGRDPLDLTDRGRTAYVYAAEVALALVFLHVRLNFPEFFTRGLFLKYWPFIIMAIAFLGIGLSELFRRQQRTVLAEPLEKTGAFLPVLPVIAYWAMRSAPAFDNPVAGQFTYANLLFVAGLAYGALALMRKSLGFGLLAALLGNGGLWAVWSQFHALGFFQHPQLWLVPLALSVLLAGQLNRGRLSDDQLKALRYAALMVIYISSTADLWINGVKDHPGLALVLAVLSVSGVMTGILLRIQSFLFAGTLFLVVAISSLIHYAAVTVNSSWPWMVAGIVLGILIVGLFGLFEKKRQEMLGLVEGLRRWEA